MIYIDSTIHHPWSKRFNAKLCKALEKNGVKVYLPQRDPSDWKETAFAAWHLTTIKKDDSVLGSLRAYSADGPANYRYNFYLQYEKVFD